MLVCWQIAALGSKGALADGLEVYVAEGTYFTYPLRRRSVAAAASGKQLGHLIFGLGDESGDPVFCGGRFEGWGV